MAPSKSKILLFQSIKEWFFFSQLIFETILEILTLLRKIITSNRTMIRILKLGQR